MKNEIETAAYNEGCAWAKAGRTCDEMHKALTYIAGALEMDPDECWPVLVDGFFDWFDDISTATSPGMPAVTDEDPDDDWTDRGVAEASVTRPNLRAMS